MTSGVAETRAVGLSRCSPVMTVPSPSRLDTRALSSVFSVCLWQFLHLCGGAGVPSLWAGVCASSSTLAPGLATLDVVTDLSQSDLSLSLVPGFLTVSFPFQICFQ